MTWNPDAVNTLVRLTTKVYRKGEEVVERDVDDYLHVTEVFGYPHVSEAPPEIIDMHFFVVAFNMEKPEGELREALAELLSEYPEPERLKGGPSYIEVGAELGSQEMAMRLFALGQALGMWKVITPEGLGIEGEDADRMAGSGFVMMTGWAPSMESVTEGTPE
jgi:hypothetical protein